MEVQVVVKEGHLMFEAPVDLLVEQVMLNRVHPQMVTQVDLVHSQRVIMVVEQQELLQTKVVVAVVVPVVMVAVQRVMELVVMVVPDYNFQHLMLLYYILMLLRLLH